MGVTISCKKTGTSINLGYDGFGNLRNKVAKLYSEEFGTHYKILSDTTAMFLSGEARKKYYDSYDKITNEMIESKRLNIKIADFCYQSDCDGSIKYGACKSLYDVIKDYDDNILYGYWGRADCAKFSDFKSIVKECYENKSDLIWS